MPVALLDAAASEPLADDGAVLGLDEGVVVGAPRSGLGELSDVKLVEQPGDVVVDVLGAVVGVEAPDVEGEGLEEVFGLPPAGNRLPVRAHIPLDKIGR